VAARGVVVLAHRRLDVLEAARRVAPPLLAPAMRDVVAILELRALVTTEAVHAQRPELREERPPRLRLELELERLLRDERLLPVLCRPPPRLLLMLERLRVRVRLRPRVLEVRLELRRSSSREEAVMGVVLENREEAVCGSRVHLACQ
jgi:hypothetical protein